MKRSFRQVNVFSSDPLLGNPLAVVHAADGLSEEQMAAFARWTHLSETTYLLTPTDAAADYRVRIFTPGGELPFAGHPTLGSCHAWIAAGGGTTRLKSRRAAVRGRARASASRRCATRVCRTPVAPDRSIGAGGPPSDHQGLEAHIVRYSASPVGGQRAWLVRGNAVLREPSSVTPTRLGGPLSIEARRCWAT